MAALLFYENPVAINKERHKEAKVKRASADYSFSAKTNSVVLAPVEFVEASREFPIVFAKGGEDRFVPVAMLGLRDEENLFVSGDGKWQGGRYIPAFIRRYPFVLADGGEGKMAVCVDEGAEGYNAEDGEALFDGEGEPSPLLKQMMDLLQRYQMEYARAEQLVDSLKELDLLKEMNARVEIPDRGNITMNGLYVVDEQKLQKLDGEALSGLMTKGYLGWIYAHLISLGNLSRLSEMLIRKGAN